MTGNYKNRRVIVVVAGNCTYFCNTLSLSLSSSPLFIRLCPSEPSQSDDRCAKIRDKAPTFPSLVIFGFRIKERGSVTSSRNEAISNAFHNFRRNGKNHPKFFHRFRIDIYIYILGTFFDAATRVCLLSPLSTIDSLFLSSLNVRRGNIDD